jgi:hypothetical protein
MEQKLIDFLKDELEKMGCKVSAVNRALYPKNLLFEIILSNNLFNKSFVGATA